MGSDFIMGRAPKEQHGGSAMKWFKHYSGAQGSESLADLRRECGLEGLARYWLLLEHLAGIFDGETTSFRVPKETIRGLLAVRSWNVLDTFAERLSTVRGLKVKRNGNVYEIDAPILLELQDRDFKKSRKDRENTAPNTRLDIDKEEDTDKDKEVEPPANVKHLNALFKGRIGESTYKLIGPKTKQVWLELYGQDLNFIATSFLSAFANFQSRPPKDQANPDIFFTNQLKYDWPHRQRHKEKQQTKPEDNSLAAWAKGGA